MTALALDNNCLASCSQTTVVVQLLMANVELFIYYMIVIRFFYMKNFNDNFLRICLKSGRARFGCYGRDAL